MKILNYIKKDFTSIFILLIALLVCLYTIAHGSNINKKCNEYWFKQVKQWENQGLCKFTFNDTIYIYYNGSGLNGIENINKNS